MQNHLRPCGTNCHVYYHRDLDIGVFSQELRLSGAGGTSPLPLSHPGDRAQVGCRESHSPLLQSEVTCCSAQLQPQILVVQGSEVCSSEVI